jgi:hypothetical protein
MHRHRTAARKSPGTRGIPLSSWGRHVRCSPAALVAWSVRLAVGAPDDDVPPDDRKPRRRPGRPPIHLSASLNLVMPSQFYPQFSSESTLPGEKRLMLAVLADAVDIFLKGDGRDARSRRLLAETAEWVRADDDGPFSFVNVCETLGLDASCLRRGLVARAAAGRIRLVRR